MAWAQSVQLDPAGSNVILSAVGWLQGTLLGNVATALAVIAVGATGLLMLTGRIDWRRGATVIVGCFIVFGAAAIVAGNQVGRGRELRRPWPSSTATRCSAP